MKARSRLKALPEIGTSAPVGAREVTLSQNQVKKLQVPHLEIQPYLAHLGTLVLGILLGLATWTLLHRVPPSSIANWLLPNSYLPFQILLFLTSFFITSFLWLNTRRGYLSALAIQIPIFLRLQQIVVTWQLVVGVVTLFVIIELLFSYLASGKHATLHQNPQTRHRRTRT